MSHSHHIYYVYKIEKGEKQDSMQIVKCMAQLLPYLTSIQFISQPQRFVIY